MEKINIEIDFQDPNLYVVGGSIIGVLTICLYYICNHRCSENIESEIELTSSQDTSQDFNTINNEIETQTDIEAQTNSQSTQTEDVEFYNILGSQFNRDVNKYMRKSNRHPIYEYEE